MNQNSTSIARSLSAFANSGGDMWDFHFLMRFSAWFLVWTLCEYLMHRLMHWTHPLNPLWQIHRHHHLIPFSVLTDKQYRFPKLSYFIFFFDNLHETLEIVLGETLPALIIYWADPHCGIPLLIFHYIYELLATDSLLEHNPDIKSPSIVSTFAVGQFHLEHHRRPHKNFGFTITLWDHLFGTFSLPINVSQEFSDEQDSNSQFWNDQFIKSG